MPAERYIIDPDARPDDQRLQALTYFDEREWLTFAHVIPGKLPERRYVIDVAGVRRRLRAEDVLPYLRGYADAGGHTGLFPPEPDEPGP